MGFAVIICLQPFVEQCESGERRGDERGQRRATPSLPSSLSPFSSNLVMTRHLLGAGGERREASEVVIGSVVRPPVRPPVNSAVSASISFFTQKLKIFFFLLLLLLLLVASHRKADNKVNNRVCPSVLQTQDQREGGGGGGAPAQSVVASSDRRRRRFWVLACWSEEGEGGGEARRQQTLGLGFGREKGFKQRRNSYFKQKIEWREGGEV